jgi:hypothetical protein
MRLVREHVAIEQCPLDRPGARAADASDRRVPCAGRSGRDRTMWSRETLTFRMRSKCGPRASARHRPNRPAQRRARRRDVQAEPSAGLEPRPLPYASWRELARVDGATRSTELIYCWGPEGRARDSGWPRDALSGWRVPTVHASLFGSAARVTATPIPPSPPEGTRTIPTSHTTNRYLTYARTTARSSSARGDARRAPFLARTLRLRRQGTRSWPLPGFVLRTGGQLMGMPPSWWRRCCRGRSGRGRHRAPGAVRGRVRTGARRWCT